MAEKQIKTVKRGAVPARCTLEGEKYELVSVINGTARIKNESTEYFVSAKHIKPTNKAAREMLTDG